MRKKLIVFVPFYNVDTEEFGKSLAYQTVKYTLVRRDRKRSKILWTKAVNDFIDQLKQWRGIKPDDVVGIMNNDISFGPDFFREGAEVKEGEIFIVEGITIDWKHKRFFAGDRIDTFPGRAFFMTVKDLLHSDGFSKLLPHYLSDYDFGIRMIKKGLKPVIMRQKIYHEDHPKVTGYKLYSVDNPFIWSWFLLKHFNRYTFLNIAKSFLSANWEKE